MLSQVSHAKPDLTHWLWWYPETPRSDGVGYLPQMLNSSKTELRGVSGHSGNGVLELSKYHPGRNDLETNH